MDNILKEIGQLFIVGFRGEKPTASYLDFLGDEQIGGVILFEENCRTHLSAHENIEIIKSRCRTAPPFVAIDQEGGPVCRLRGAPVEIKSASEYAREDNLEGFKEDYSRAAVLLDSLGVNLNLAPVADIHIHDANRCLSDRCYGSEPDQVARFVHASVTIARRQGLLSCVKHFPGLGAAVSDPHQETAEADYDQLVWQQREKVPFATAIEAGVDMIMTTHLRVASLDDQIATGSQNIVLGLIRGELGFDGPIVTDDLSMKGAACLGHPGERAVAAFAAGHDLLLFGQNHEEAVRAFDFLAESIRRGEIGPDRVRASLDRIAGLKFKLDRSIVR